MYDRSDSPFDTVDRVAPLDDLDDLPTVESARRAAADRSAEALSTTLPVDAQTAFETFCDVSLTPRWVSVVQSVTVLSRVPGGRARRAAYVARLQNGTIGYTLHYRYDERARIVTWGTSAGSMTLVAGRAQFHPLGDRATLMEYQLTLELPEDALPPWEDPYLTGHATSVMMNDFREWVVRLHRP